MFELSGFWTAAVGLAGRIDFHALTEALGRPGASGWSRDQLRAAGLREEVVDRLLGGSPLFTKRPFLTLADERYPPRLIRTQFPPPVLFYEGELGFLEGPLVAIVGSRVASGNGITLARRLAQAVTSAGGGVVSGLARGIDAAAHEAAVPRTVAVLGQGLDHGLDGARGDLLERMAAGEGLVVSELLPSWGGTKWTFPRRNRVIAGLADVTVVVEAGRKSGALITARWALDFGRDVFAVPGSPLVEQSAGCLDLLEAGAQMARDGRELVRALGLEHKTGRHDPLLEGLGLYGADLDTLIARTGMAPGLLRERLDELELTGRVRRLPGEYYLPVR